VKRKHRVMVEITFEEPCAVGEALAFVEDALFEGRAMLRNDAKYYDDLDWRSFNDMTKVIVKSGERVIAALRHRRKADAL